MHQKKQRPAFLQGIGRLRAVFFHISWNLRKEQVQDTITQLNIFVAYMASNFNTYYENIDSDFWRNLCVEKGVLRHYEKGELFAEEERIAKYIGYIKSGSLKYVVYAPDGTERVVGLEFDGEFVADFPFSLYGKKSRVSIVAVTPCEIYCISAREIGTLMKSDADLYRVIAESSIALFDTTYNRYIDLYIKSAKERYDELVEKHEDIFSIFSLKDIASFLNITPTYLSRLRKSYGK